MSTVATETRLTRIGVVVALYPSDPSLEMEIQRAPDSSGSPDTGSAEIIALVPAGTRTYTDLVSGGTWHYRIRHVRAGANPSPWTRWVAGTGVAIPGDLPTIPSIAVPVVEAKAEQAGSVGTVTLEITDPMVRVTATAFQPISGGGAFDLSTDPTGWAVFDETDPFTLTDDVALTSKHTSRIAWAVRYLDPDGNEQWFRGIETMDLDLIAEVTHVEVTFDENGETIVSASGDEDAVDLHVTVGNGTTPADPTDSVNDGSTGARSGAVETGVKITTGRDAVVKVVGENASGELGPVVTTRQFRPIGPFHKDATSRASSSTSLTTVETITVPANALGADGALRLTLTFQSIGSSSSKEFYILWDGSAVVSHTAPSSHAGASRMEMLLTNDGGASSQEVAGRYENETPTINLTRATPSADTTADVDIEVKVRAGGTDAITLNLSVAEFIGTS